MVIFVMDIPFCPPDGAQLDNVCELQKHERALFYDLYENICQKTLVHLNATRIRMTLNDWFDLESR